MRTIIFLALLFISQFSFAGGTDSLIHKQKGWYVSAAVTRTFMFAPLLNWRGNNPNAYMVYPVTPYIGYRLTPKIRVQGGVSYLESNFNRYYDYGFHGWNDYKPDDRGQFLSIDLQIKGYALNQQYHMQPYLSAGIIARNYWLQQNHVLYTRNTTEEVNRINKNYNGTTFHWTVNPGLQYRFLNSFELFTELNIRNPIGNLSYTKIWRNDIAKFNGISAGVTYHLPNKK